MVDINPTEIKLRMSKAIDSFKKDLSSLRVGRASSSMLDQINVNAYGNYMPINQISTISVPEARLLLVSVWDSSLVSITEKSIRESPLGLNPMVEGNVIRISIPALSEDRRVEITKVASKYAENAKIAVRNIRRDNIENTRKLQKNSEISDDAVNRLKKFANEYKVDIPQKEGDHIGPVISETQYNKIQGLIKKGIDEGANLIAGGPGKPDGLEDGYYVKPTVFADVNNNMEIARTEIFGPVLSVIPFETEQEAIEIANDTPYGLTNYIQTEDQEKVKRVARKLRSGMIVANTASLAVDAPFGGFKHSGIGREGGKEGLLEFLEVKSIGGWN